MARARNIKPGFFLNDELAELDPLARLLFAGLWCIADREGRLEDRPKKIKAEVLPYDDCDVDKFLNDLQDHGFIIRYEVDGNRYIQVTNFKKHQNPHIKEAASIIPPPPEYEPAPEMHSANTVQEPEMHNENPADSLKLIPDSLNTTTTYSPPPDKSDKSGGDGGPQDVHHTETLSTGSTDSSETNDGLTVAVKAFEGYGYGTVNFGISEALTDLVTEYGGEWVKEALYEGMLQGRRTLKYVEGILQRWRREGGPNHSLAHSRDRPELEGVRAKPYQVLAGGDEL